MKRSYPNRRKGKSLSFNQVSKSYLDHERGTLPVKKEALVRIALVYPQIYSVGMASMGFQTIYRLFNNHPGASCERAFIWNDFPGKSIRTLETGDDLNRFDIVAFSISFELDINHVIHILRSSHIPLFARDRTAQDPLIITGGVVAGLNPSPLFPFMDGLLVGEGEGFCTPFIETFLENKDKKYSRDQSLESLSQIPGLFVPGISKQVTRQMTPDLESHPTYTSIVSPRSHFENMFVVEVARGCTRGCRFCAAEKVYQPYRFRSAESVIETIARYNPGAQRIGLESAGLSDYPNLIPLCQDLIETGYQLSFSSIRPDCVSKELVEVVEKGGSLSFTVAPEAGSEKLRNRIGKRITDDRLMETVNVLSQSRLKTLKFYFIIGLPGETDEDIDQLIRWIKDARGIFLKGDPGRRVRVSVNAFIPKPFTEFQWAGMCPEKVIRKKRQFIKKSLKGMKGIVLTSKSTREEILQGLLSIGDERIGLALSHSIEKNISWRNALKVYDIDVNALLHENKKEKSSLPWDFIESHISKKQLWKKYQSSV